MPSRDASKRPDNSQPMWQVLIKKYGVWGAVRLLYTDVLPDFRYGIDTARPVGNLQLTSSDKLFEHNRYVPSTFDAVVSSLNHVASRIDLSQSGFLDYGSGKAKALIAATRFPFREITGIELNRQLHDIACRNIDRMKLSDRVTCLCSDASTFDLRPNDTVLYFFNPFTGSVLERCLDRIEKSSSGISRQIIYLNPTEDVVFCRYFEKWDEVDLDPGGVEVNFYVTR